MRTRVYEACPTKRARRTKAEMEEIRKAIESVLEVERPATVRQVFYQLVSRGVIEKSEKEYSSTVCRLLSEMRREERIPYGWIADNTRWMRKPDTWSSLDDALRSAQNGYRRALWDNQDAYVEIWCEKDALSGVLVDVTAKWDVPLMISKGFASLSFLKEAADAIEEQDKPTYLYYFGDHDPSGVKIDQAIERTLREMAPCSEIHFERMAVVPEQIEEMGLPTRPTKMRGTHSKTWSGGDSVEVDAIPPSKLREMCEECILVHIDEDELATTRAVEQAERETLSMMVERGLSL